MPYLRSFKLLLTCIGLSVITTNAQSLDIGEMTIEQYVDKVFASFEEDLPYGSDIECPKASRFGYIKNSWQPYPLKVEQFNKACKTIYKYDQFIFENLNEFWQVADQFGLQVIFIESSKDLNGAYEQRPILNKKIIPSFILYHYDHIDYSLNAPIWSHEYGHAVLGNFIDEHFFPLSKDSMIQKVKLYTSDNNQLVSKLNELTTKQDDLYTERDNLAQQRQQAHEHKNDEDYNRLNQQHQRVISELAKVNVLHYMYDNKLENLTNGHHTYLSYLTGTYHEFFADVFAGLYYDDINVIGNNFEALGGDFIKISDYRRFIPTKERIHSNSWDNFQNHHFFTPTRHLLGTLDLSVLNTKKKKKYFIRKLAEFIIKDVQYLIQVNHSQDFISYDKFKKIVGSATNYKSIKVHIDELEKQNKLSLSLSKEDLRIYCEENFVECKQNILSELSIKKEGLFKLSPDIKKSNQRLSNALIQILDNF